MRTGTFRRMLLAAPLALIAASLCLPTLAADLDKGLVAHWTLDDTGTDKVADTGGRHPGTVHGALAGAPAPIGTGFRFDGDNDTYIEVPGTLQLKGNQMTVSALVKPERFSPADFTNQANSRNGILGSADANLIFSLTDGGRVTFIWDAAENKYQTIITDSEVVVPAGEFSHVAITRDGPTMVVYINGVRIGRDEACSDAPFQPFDRLQIGRVNGTPHRDFHGTIDDVRLYDRVLSADEIGGLAELAGLRGKKLPEPPPEARPLTRLKYNNPGLVVDLGVGLWAWPLPMDFDGDGDIDLVVSCSDKPYHATVLFENPGGDAKMPVFKPAVKLGEPRGNCCVSVVDGQVRVTTPGREHPDFHNTGLDQSVPIPTDPSIHTFPGKLRANQWSYADYDGDGAADLIVGTGDWSEYGWDNAYDDKGNWTNGPLRGRVYVLRNEGDNKRPKYAAPQEIMAGGKPVDVYGMPSPNLADFDGDGDLDLICGEFIDSFTWFENTGTRTQPKYAAGRLLTLDGKPLRMELCMIVPVAIDFDKDGDVDLVVGQEDGRVALIDNTGKTVDGMPRFAAPVFFRQEADELKFGALVTPVGFDWDDDGDEDLICGNTAGHIGFIENLDGGDPPRWAEPKLLEAGGETLRILAGPNGSIQGPCEAKWGYTTLNVADWDHDGLPDLVVNSIWGKVVWYRNVGTRKQPKLAAAQPIEVEWEGTPPKPAWNWWNPGPKELATQWRTTPVVIDFDSDGLNDLVMLDHEGYLALFRRERRDDRLVLLPPQRIFYAAGAEDTLLQLNAGEAGRSGRRKLCMVDYDGDGRRDLLANSRSINFFRNVSTDENRHVFKDMGPMDAAVLAGHTTSPTVVDWDRDGIPDLLVGAEDGFFYYKKNPRSPEGKP
ncbi:MAG: VCBS repeat-containing protein [Planctomycetaceae bacterium]|nr:VCBS repeat-containing protein [Planctomycetaceae bacterium]